MRKILAKFFFSVGGGEGGGEYTYLQLLSSISFFNRMHRIFKGNGRKEPESKRNLSDKNYRLIQNHKFISENVQNLIGVCTVCTRTNQTEHFRFAN